MVIKKIALVAISLLSIGAMQAGVADFAALAAKKGVTGAKITTKGAASLVAAAFAAGYMKAAFKFGFHSDKLQDVLDIIVPTNPEEEKALAVAKEKLNDRRFMIKSAVASGALSVVSGYLAYRFGHSCLKDLGVIATSVSSEA